MEKKHKIFFKDVMLKLLSISIFGKVLDWYITLLINSITTWAQLVETLIIKFNEVGDPYSLLSQFNIIQRHPKENVSNFNLRFFKSCARVPLAMRPHPYMDLMFYLKEFTPNLDSRI